MKYLLDTNVCIIYLKGRNSNLKQKLEALPIQEIVICSVVRAELCFGAMKSIVLAIRVRTNLNRWLSGVEAKSVLIRVTLTI